MTKKILSSSLVDRLIKRWIGRLRLDSYRIEWTYVSEIDSRDSALGSQTHIQGNQHFIRIKFSEDFDQLRETIIHELFHVMLGRIDRGFDALLESGELSNSTWNVFASRYREDLEWVVHSLVCIFLRKNKEFDDEDLRPKKDK